MHITRKILLTAMMLMVMMSIVSCDDTNVDSDKVVLNYYSHLDENGERTEMIRDFEKKYPNIEINLVELPRETDRKLAMLIDVLKREDGELDVFDGDVVWPAVFASAGWILPLDGYLSDDEISDFLPGAMFSIEFDGKHYGIPYRSDSGMLYYRKDLLDKYDRSVPRTWDELVETSEYIVSQEDDDELYGYAGSWYKSEGLTCNFTEFLWGFGGRVLDYEGKVVLDSPEAIRAVTQMVDLKNKHKITPDDIMTYTSGSARAKFKEGKIIFLRDWPRGWNQFENDEDSKVSGLVAVDQVPTEYSDSNRYATLGGWQIMVSSASKHIDEAVKFAKYRASEEVQIKMAKELNHIPSRISLYRNGVVLEAMPFLEAMYPVIKNAYPRPKSDKYNDLSRIIQTELQKAFEGDITAEEAVKNSDRRIKVLLGQ